MRTVHPKLEMAKDNFFSNIVILIFKALFSVRENPSRELNQPRKVLIVRQQNQLGDLLASVSLFRAIKDTYPDVHLSMILSPENSTGLVKNKFLDSIYIFDKKKLLNPFYICKTIKFLRKGYDLVIAPVVVSISFTSNLLARLAKTDTRIGANSLNGITNPSKFFFDRRIDLDWRDQPDSNVAERILDIVKPFGINTDNYKSEISFDDDDLYAAKNFINEFADKRKRLLIGLHVGAGKPTNRWSLDNYAALVARIERNYPANFYLTGGWADKEELDYILKHCDIKFGKFFNRPITQVAALVSLSDLFITNDTGIMHVAGTTDTPQISIFGPTNPFNWSPVGVDKYFIRKSDLIDDVSINDVYHLCEMVLKRKGELN